MNEALKSVIVYLHYLRRLILIMYSYCLWLSGSNDIARCVTDVLRDGKIYLYIVQGVH